MSTLQVLRIDILMAARAGCIPCKFLSIIVSDLSDLRMIFTTSALAKNENAGRKNE